ncbi:o-succinylbenzoate synthase [Nonlabens spongiae]|uniref:O-succinylbenzoate synthase n=1 Tax=Nonlabens spongiae TaxID=331648 RepID=A0A1W6MNI4_9FLAO|nr:o-succinylbenzoate synthase [Nonlabens spongiae]ARN79173.1 o-succinylbenzoate synthase [Nonlabens spongiae]
MKARYISHTLHFKQPSGTSRGVLKTKDTFFIIIEHEENWGVGEVNLFRGLSYDDREGFEEKLKWTCENIGKKPAEMMEELKEWPSILFGYEMAVKSYQSSTPFELFPSLFTQGQGAININGLVWMGDQDFMQRQIEEKLKQGFDCIKLKIGAIDFGKELELLKSVRSRFPSAAEDSPKARRESEITLRVDANGAFSPDEAAEKLEKLSQFDIHSIEQPIKQNQWEAMAQVCEISAVDVALDEELIGITDREEKIKCLETIKPQYIILKPALVGGFQSTREWIDLAEARNIGWWITSALESNVGLNAIAQFTYTLGTTMPQGLGTGGLFTNNIECPLEIKNGKLICNANRKWDTNLFKD